jgi:hypothetical protein
MLSLNGTNSSTTPQNFRKGDKLAKELSKKIGFNIK